MAENVERRNLLRDTAISVLASQGAHGLTHRVLDREAGLPKGTAKNYYPTRDALLEAAGTRIYQRYQHDLAQLDSLVPARLNRDSLPKLLADMIRSGTHTDRPRLLALLELHAEATRNPRLQELLANQAAIDYAVYERLQKAAGLPVTPEKSRILARCVYAALLSLLTKPPTALAAEGLDDLEGFAAGVLDSVYPR